MHDTHIIRFDPFLLTKWVTKTIKQIGDLIIMIHFDFKIDYFKLTTKGNTMQGGTGGMQDRVDGDKTQSKIRTFRAFNI